MIDKGYLGSLLIKKGFEVFTRYLFRVLERRPFEVEAIHKDLFQYFQSILDGTAKRVNINIPPRSGKTTLAKYFVVYVLTKNPRANIIYTSYSQSLLSDIALSVSSILEHPIYKALYPSSFQIKEEEMDPVDDFWKDYMIENFNKNTYSSKKITTQQGGICLFSAIGGQITGYGAGIRRLKKDIGGALIIDDANKPADIHSQVMREKVEKYFKETLLSRLNDSNTPIVNIQQRLHLDDLSGFLINQYNFQTLKKPLIDSNGVCLLPNQYTPERVRELQVDNYTFSSQYQQEPIIAGGQIIKKDWFGYYDIDRQPQYVKIAIAADTAIATKEYSDYSCFLVGGVTPYNKLHILEIVHGKWEYPELKRQAVEVYNRWQLDKRTTSASSLYIENRASGQQLIQDFKKTGLPVIPIEVTKDKLSRVQEILDFIASGCVQLPQSEGYGNNKLLLNECEAFSRDMSHSHDDIVDTLVHLINNTIAHREVSILEVL